MHAILWTIKSMTNVGGSSWAMPGSSLRWRGNTSLVLTYFQNTELGKICHIFHWGSYITVSCCSACLSLCPQSPCELCCHLGWGKSFLRGEREGKSMTTIWGTYILWFGRTFPRSCSLKERLWIYSCEQQWVLGHPLSCCVSIWPFMFPVVPQVILKPFFLFLLYKQSQCKSNFK